MTANELANELDLRRSLLTGKEHELGARAILLYGHSADMLRQQQAEIGRLKQIIDANNLNQNIGQFVKPANEPYLTDEEIWKLWQTHLNDEITVFAKALIKEASEK